MNELLEAAAVAEEVAVAGEAVVPVDLSTVSQQLDQVLLWQAAQTFILALAVGVFLGAVLALVIGRAWKV